MRPLLLRKKPQPSLTLVNLQKVEKCAEIDGCVKNSAGKARKS